MFNDWFDLAGQQLAGGTLSRDDARAILAAPDDEVMDLVAAGGRLRRAHFDNWVKVNYLLNLKSGLCPEDCGYCSQRLGSEADVLKYRWLPQEEALQAGESRDRGRRLTDLHGFQWPRPERRRRRARRATCRRTEG